MIDLDSWKWWVDFFHKCVTSLGVTWLTIDRLWERFWKVEEFIERRSGGDRRHTMDITRYLKLIPLLEKLANDLEAAAKSPEDQAVVADIKALIADIGAPPASQSLPQ